MISRFEVQLTDLFLDSDSRLVADADVPGYQRLKRWTHRSGLPSKAGYRHPGYIAMITGLRDRPPGRGVVPSARPGTDLTAQSVVLGVTWVVDRCM
jgi:hypothetical protein